MRKVIREENAEERGCNVNEKRVEITVAASGDSKEVMLQPGATVREVLSECGLDGYQLSRKGQEPLSPDLDLFKDAADSERFYATPSNLSVGGGGSASLFRFFNQLKTNKDLLVSRFKYRFEKLRNQLPIFRRKRARVVRTRSFKTKTRTSKIKVKVKSRVIPKEKGTRVVRMDKEYPYWQENGWTRTKKGYQGHYRTNHGKWQGFIQENYKGNHSFYIFNPPAEVKKGSHGSCFFHIGDGIHLVHFNKNPKDVSSGIVTIENVISRSFSGKED